MSWWTDIRDFTEASLAPEFEGDSARKRTGGITGALNRGYSDLGGAFNRVIGRTGTGEKREQAQDAQNQVQAYQDQTNLENQQLQETQNEEAVQKRQIEGKQIRMLRNNYSGGGRAAGGSGFLNNQNLGDQTGLNNKLGV